MLFGQKPYKSVNPQDLLEEMEVPLQMKFDVNRISQMTDDLIRGLLHVNPTLRMSHESLFAIALQDKFPDIFVIQGQGSSQNLQEQNFSYNPQSHPQQQNPTANGFGNNDNGMLIENESIGNLDGNRLSNQNKKANVESIPVGLTTSNKSVSQLAGSSGVLPVKAKGSHKYSISSDDLNQYRQNYNANHTYQITKEFFKKMMFERNKFTLMIRLGISSLKYQNISSLTGFSVIIILKHAKQQFEKLKSSMDIDSIFKQYDDPNLIIDDPGFSEFDRMIKSEEYKLLTLLRKIRDIIPFNHVELLDPTLKNELCNVTNLCMDKQKAKDILMSHLDILLEGSRN